MKFTVSKTSDWKYKSEVELNTLEELINFIKEHDENIVIHEDFSEKNEFTIEIYDDYRE